MARKKSIADIEEQVHRLSNSIYRRYKMSERGQMLQERTRAIGERYKDNIRKSGLMKRAEPNLSIREKDDILRENIYKKIPQRIYMGMSNG